MNKLLAAFFLCLPFVHSSALLAQDSTPPIVQSVVPPAGGTIGSLTQITVNFSEPVRNVAATDLLVNGVPAVGLSGSGASYTFQLESEPTPGAVQITWDPSHDIRDLAPAANRFDETAPGAKWQYTLFDGTPPSVSLTLPATGLTVRSLTRIDITFTEAVVGVDAADLLINGTPATALEILGVGRYRFTFPQPAPGTVNVQWSAGHGIRDLAVAPNAFAGGAWTYALDPSLGVPAIRLNEFVASNLSGLRDEEGEPQDWIEIWNYGTSEVNLAGYALTDDREDPGRWTFPATNLAPGQFLVVFASGKDRRSPASPGLRLHTNFQLAPGGEYLGLYNGDSPRVVISELTPEYPEQRNDYAYGLNGAGQWRYYATPTPGAPNGESAIESILDPPHFNVSRGLFDQPFELILSHPTYGVTIRYTLDGSEPAQTNGQIYFSPVTISNSTPVRAAAFRSGWLPSVTVTHTYIFPSQVLKQPNAPPGYPTGATVMGGYPADYEMDPEIVTNAAYAASLKASLTSLPSVSLATSVDNLFGPTNGIYTHASDSTTLYRGVAWERPCSIEFMPNDGSAGFTINCGVRIQGNASRNPQKTPKHPFRLLFKNDYGPGRLEAEVFPDSPVRSFNTLVMRADFNNSWLHWDPTQRSHGTRIRDAWVKDTWRAMGQAGSHSRYFHLYLNGIYWGIYDFGERVDATLAANYLGGEPENYDAVASKPVSAVDGDLTAYNAMVSAIVGRPQAVLSNYQAVLALLDIENFADYMLLNFYGANQDWGNDSNWNAVRRRTPAGRFKYVSWDGEQLLVGLNDNRVASTDVPGGLHTSLVASPEYRLSFADRVHRHLFNGGALSADAVSRRWRTRANELTNAILAESARWGDYRRDVYQYQNPPYILYTRDQGTTNWLAEINRLLNDYFPQRGDVFLSQLRAAGLYPAINAPVFSRPAGLVPRGFNLSLSAADPIYYTLDGSDPRVFGTGAVSPTALLASGPVVLNSSTLVKARSLAGSTWSALNEASYVVESPIPPLRITEIMYNPPGGDAYEYLELQNIGSAPLDVGGFSIEAIAYVFAPGTILSPGQIIILAPSVSPSSWAARYPGVAVFATYSGKLDNSGEKVAITGRSGELLWSVEYDDSNGWPLEADGLGSSLEILDPYGDPDDPANWRASASRQGTPGNVTGPPVPGNITLNEILAENLTAVSHAGTFPDFVELRNAGNTAADLSGWSLTDDSNPRRFVFPAGTTIGAGGYLVLWCDTNSATPGLHTGFALGRHGDALFLYDAATNRADSLGFGLQLPDYSIGRIGADWVLNQPTPNAPNQSAAVESSSNLTLNEWMANAVPGGDDWLELYNRANSPVSLGGVYVAVGGSIDALPPRSFVGPKGYVQLLADGNAGARHLDFKLPAEGSTLILYNEAGAELERVTYAQQSSGVSEGRLPDGTATIVRFPSSASPEAANYLLSWSGPVLNEVLASNRAGATNVAGRTADFVELRNPAGTSFDLSGYRLANGDGSAQWTFPSGTIISASGYLVVWFDEGWPASTAAGSFLNTGRSLSAASDVIALVNLAGQPVDTVVFGPQVTDQSIGRMADSSWRLLTGATPSTINGPPAGLGSAGGLRINEWLAAGGNEDDWVELMNTGSQPVDLSGVALSDHPPGSEPAFALPTLSYVSAGGFVQLRADGHPSLGGDHLNFSLDAAGETIYLTAAGLGVIDSISFGPQEAGVSAGRLPDGTGPITAFPLSPTPGASNYRPLPDVVINEILPQAALGTDSAVELRNLSTAAINVGGWYLSDAGSNFRKYKLPLGTTLAASGYLAIHQDQFGSGAAAIPFTLEGSRAGEVWLSEAINDVLSGRRAHAAFGPADSGLSFGRFVTTIGVDYPAASQPTIDASNTPVRVGPVVINELMYHPPEFGGSENPAEEFVELHNPGMSAVSLYDAAFPTRTWRLRGDVDFDFPTGLTLGSRGYLLLVSFDPVANPTALNAFRARYSVAASVPVIGPFIGRLDNAGGELTLLKPRPGATGPDIPYVEIDRVAFDDDYPWPTAADGSGPSLQRRRPFDYGNEPTNWKADGPTAGRANVPGSSSTDTDGDGLPDAWELANSFNPSNAADASQDADGDGRTNYEEYFAGTNPRSAASVANAPVVIVQPQSIAVSAGMPAQFSVEVSGTAPLAYQWRRNGEIIFGATASTLSLSAVGPGNAGEYTVVAWNAAGYVVSRAATLTVYQPPIVLLQPQSQIIASNGNATLTVGGIGTGTLRYQWQFNGVDLPNATNASLSISNATLANEGDYRAWIIDDFASAVSDVARLTVRVGPRLLVPPVGITNVVGASATFYATASGSVPMSFQWRRASTPLTNQILMTTNASFTLNNLQTNDSATYRLVVTNFGPGVATIQFPVLVVAPPLVTASPTNATAGVGGAVAFAVTVGGTGPFAYQWFFQDAPIAGATNSSYALASVAAADQGGYRVVVTNLAGSANSAVASLVVSGTPPTIIAQPRDQEAAIGGSATFSVTAIGDGLLSYQWRRASFDLPGRTSAALSIDNVQAADFDLYSVHVANAFGSITSDNARLGLAGPLRLSDLERLANGTVRMNLSGPINRTYQIDYSANLSSWQALKTVAYTNGLMPVIDSTSVGVTNRFYRARTP